ncbi:MAG: hypothetical protein ABI867_18890 [Kofleriaceae bacterium]
MSVVDGAKRGVRWIAAREPRTLLIAGWVVFVLAAYPGYMSVDSTLQLYTVRSGDYSDYAPVMTALWGALEYVAAGPFPMLALQSGLFVFGLAALLRRVMSPRAAAVTAPAVLVFPAVLAPMAVIWPDSLMAGALVAGIAALLEDRPRWRVTGMLLLIVACSCRPEIVLALTPLVMLVIPKSTRWRRAAIALAMVIGIAGVARVTDWVLTTTDTYSWRQTLMMTDLVGTLRRAKVKDDAALHQALAGLTIADNNALTTRMNAGVGALRWWPLANGDARIFDPITTAEQSDVLTAAWRHTIAERPGGYAVHRWAMTRSLIGISGNWEPIYDNHGDPQLLAPLHHRAESSDWQYGMQQFVRLVGKTPLFRPWLYLILAVAMIVLNRRIPVIRNLVASGLAYQVAMVIFAPAPDYRYSHWMVTTTCIAIAATIVTRSWRRRMLPGVVAVKHGD